MDRNARLETTGTDKLGKTLLCEALDIFVMEYDYDTGNLYIDPNKRKFIKVPWRRENIINRQFENLVFRPDIPRLQSFMDMEDITQENYKREIVVRLFVDLHRYAWFRISMIGCFNETDEKKRLLAAFANVDEVVEMEQRLKYNAERDFKTHLLHENAFVERVKKLLAEHTEVEYQLVLMNIEHFNLITGMFGAIEGDNLLRYLAVKLQECLDDEVRTAQARIASENFAILIPTPAYSVQEVIEYLERAISRYPSICNLSLSFGVYPITEDVRQKQVPVHLMIDRARAASAMVRDNYIRHVAYYDDSMGGQEEREMQVINRMYLALEQEEYLIYLQPLVDLETGRITGAEALVRWQFSEHEIKMPGEFIPIFEKNGFIIELDRYMIEHICRIIRRWLDMDAPVLPLSVNLSRVNLYNPKLLDSIEECVEKYRVPRELIEFELTESEFAAENKYMIQLSESLRERGFLVIMDDFGSGYSSLNALKEIPTDGLKIDGRFLTTEGDTKKSDLILKYIMMMAKDMGVKTVVEGVEDGRKAKFLLGIGCRTAQGYYYYRPMPLDKFEETIRQEPISLKERMQADGTDD